MNYVKNMLVAVLLLLSANLIRSFEKPTNLGRYSEIIKSFDVDAKKFDPKFVFSGQDIEVIKTRKELLKKDLESKKITYATSWMPLLYKILGIGFGLESIRRLLVGGYMIIADRNVVGGGFRSSGVWEAMGSLLGQSWYINYPISYPIAKTERFVRESVLDRLYVDAQGNMDGGKYFDAKIKAIKASSFGISLGTGILAKYLFNKAASYKNEIASIEQEIEIDDAMIDALSRN